MFIKFFALTIVTITSAYAVDFSVDYGLYRYEVKQEEKAINLSGKNLSVSLEKKADCKKDVFDKFHKELSAVLKKIEIRKAPGAKKIKISFDNKETWFSRKSPTGRYFLRLPEKFRRLKIQQKLACK